MPEVKVLRPHTVGGIVRKRGEVYSENERLTDEKVRIGLVEKIRSKAESAMYEPRESKPKVRITGRTGNWYLFSDGDKALGKKAAAEKLGVEELPDVDFNDN